MNGLRDSEWRSAKLLGPLVRAACGPLSSYGFAEFWLVGTLSECMTHDRRPILPEYHSKFSLRSHLFRLLPCDSDFSYAEETIIGWKKHGRRRGLRFCVLTGITVAPNSSYQLPCLARSLQVLIDPNNRARCSWTTRVKSLVTRADESAVHKPSPRPQPAV